MTNEDIARRLREQASEFTRTGNNLYRIRAFRQAAMAVLSLPDEVTALVATGGPTALERLPGIGKSLADTIAGYVGDERPAASDPIPIRGVTRAGGRANGPRVGRC
jgi:DNA polymerase (family 10)